MKKIKGFKINFLLYMALLIVAAMSVLSYISYTISRQAIFDAVKSQMKQVIKSKSLIIGDWFQDREFDLSNWAADKRMLMALNETYIGRAARKPLNKFFQIKKDDYPFYYSLSLVQQDGRVIASSNENLIGSQVDNEAIFNQANAAKSAMSDAYFNPENVPVVSIAVPVFEQGVVKGIIIGSISINRIYQRFIKPLRFGEQSYGYLIDKGGQNVAHPDPSVMMKQHINMYGFSKQMYELKAGDLFYTYKGVRKMVAFEQCGKTGWLVAVCAPVKELLKPVEGVKRLTIITSLLFIVATIIIISLLYKRIIFTPMQTLIEGISQLGKGQHSHKIELEDGNEFASIADSFNDMAENLKSYMASVDILQESETRFQNMARSVGEWLWEIDQQGRFVYSNQVVENLIGYKPDELIGHYIYDYYPNNRRNELKYEMQQFMEARKEFFNHMFIMVHRKGQQVITECTGVPLFDDDGIFRGYRGVQRDISERINEQIQMEVINNRLQEVSRQAGMAEIATGVLHNIGNVLNSANVSAEMLAELLRTMRFDRLIQALELIEENKDNLEQFLAHNERGRQLLPYLAKLAGKYEEQKKQAMTELNSISENIHSIKEIVEMQQQYATMKGTTEMVSLHDVIHDVVKLNENSIKRHHIQLEEEYEELPEVSLDKHKFLQVIINLIQNAKNAVVESGNDQKIIKIRLKRDSGGCTVIVADNGIGIEKQRLVDIFAFGYTTRENGHGFGLHISALAARQLGGTLVAESDGPGKGASLIFKIPLHDINGMTG